MASTPSPLLRLELQADGENLNTWGQKLNTLFQLVEQAVHSGAEIDIPVEGDVTLTSTNYVANQERRGVLRFTGTGGYTITFSGKARKYLIVNDCAGTVTLSDGGATVSIEAGERDIAITDGTDFELMGFSTLNTQLASYLLKTGGTLTGALNTNSNITMTAGAFTLAAAPTADLHASTKKYVDDTAFTANAGVLPGQSGNSGKFLTTDGTVASWSAVDLSPYLTIATAASTYQAKLTRRNVTNADSPVTAAYGDDISCDTSGGAITINLPAAVAGNPEIVIRAGADAVTANITVEPDGAETILGESNLVIDINYFAYSFAAKAGAWV
jgi:hypothetical protein